MRVVLDTNVLVSAFISKHGIPAEILDLVATLEEVKLVLSEEILDEFTSVMSRPEVKTRFGYSERQVAGFRKAIEAVAEIVEIESKLNVVEEDPTDDVIINTSVDGRADYVVTGDKHLLNLKKFENLRIVSPRNFLTVVADGFSDLILKETEPSEREN